MLDNKLMYALRAKYLTGEKKGMRYGVYTLENVGFFPGVNTIVEEDSPETLGRRIGKEWNHIVKKAETHNLSFRMPSDFPEFDGGYSQKYYPFDARALRYFTGIPQSNIVWEEMVKAVNEEKQ